MTEALVALGARTNLWQLPPAVDDSGGAGLRLIRLCLGVLQNEPGAGRRLYALAMDTNSFSTSAGAQSWESAAESAQALTFHCLAAARDGSAKEMVLERLGAEATGDFVRVALPYLEHVATEGDLPILEKCAAAAYGVTAVTGKFADDRAVWRRMIEDTIRCVRLRILVERSLGGAPRPPPPEG